MENVSLSSNHTITASSFVPCFRLPEFAQWRNEYLTPVVFSNSVAAATINGLLLPVTAILNALVMICISVNRQLRRKPFMIMLLSLSATDFLTGFLVQPLFIISRVSELIGRQDVVCHARRLQTVVGVACAGASLFHICLIGAERYLAVRFPHRYKDLLTNGRVVMTVLFIWLFTTTYAVLPYVGLLKGGSLVGRSVIMSIVIGVTVAFYIGIFLETITFITRRNNNRGTASVSPGVPSHSRSQGSNYGPAQSESTCATSGNSSDDSPNVDQSVRLDGKFLQPSTSWVRMDQTSRIEDKSGKYTNSPSANQSVSHDGKFLQPCTNGVRMEQISRMEDKSGRYTNSPCANQSVSHDGKFFQPCTSGVRMDQTSRMEDKSGKYTNAPSANQSVSHDGKFLMPSSSGVRMDQTSRLENKLGKYTNRAHTLGQPAAAALQRKMKEKKLAKTMLITVAFLAFCYFPETIAYPLLPKSQEEMAVNWIVLSWTNIMVHFNSFINPVWYSWRMPDLRKAVLKLVIRR